MDLSVVIPCRNAAGVIGEQLAALSRQEWQGRWEVIVADNGSQDDTAAVVNEHKKHLPQLRLVDASHRPGAAHARNVGVAAARGKAIAFCDADDQVGSGWLAAMGGALRDRQFVAARLDLAKLNPTQAAQAVKNPQENDLQRVGYPPHLPHASGGTLGIAREAHQTVGGFDEDLPYLEDTDYCFRVQRQGIPLQFLPEAVVHYRLKDKHHALFSQSRCWGRYNVLLYKRYRENMRLTRPWRRHLSRWYGLMRRVPFLYRQQHRYAWIKALGTQVGVLQGALRYRVPPVAGVLFSLAKSAHVWSQFLHE